jgi:hypothetical protein
MTTALPRLVFDKRAQICLEDLELLQEVSQRLEDVGERLANFEVVLAEANEGDPIFDLHSRLDGLDKRLTALDVKQRRPFPVQLYTNDPPAAVKRPDAVDLREAVDARDRMATAIKKHDEELRAVTARFAGMAGQLDYLCGQEWRQKVARVTDAIESLIDDRLRNRKVFSELQGRLTIDEKFNARLDKCATEFRKMREVQAAIETKLAALEEKQHG